MLYGRLIREDRAIFLYAYLYNFIYERDGDYTLGFYTYP